MIAPNGARFWVQRQDGTSFPEHGTETKVDGLKTTMTCCEYGWWV